MSVDDDEDPFEHDGGLSMEPALAPSTVASDGGVEFCLGSPRPCLQDVALYEWTGQACGCVAAGGCDTGQRASVPRCLQDCLETVRTKLVRSIGVDDANSFEPESRQSGP